MDDNSSELLKDVFVGVKYMCCSCCSDVRFHMKCPRCRLTRVRHSFGARTMNVCDKIGTSFVTAQRATQTAFRDYSQKLRTDDRVLWAIRKLKTSPSNCWYGTKAKEEDVEEGEEKHNICHKRRYGNLTVSNVILGASILTFLLLCALTLFSDNDRRTNPITSDLSPPPLLLLRRSIHHDEKNLAVQKKSAAAESVCSRDLAPVLVPEIKEWRSNECQEEQYGAQYGISIVLTFESIRNLKATLVTIRKTVDISTLKDMVVVSYGNVTVDVLKYLYWFAKEEVYFAQVLLIPEDDMLTARNKGAEIAKGDTLVFIQAGVIPSQGWLEPLVDVVSNKINRVVVPHYDVLVELNTYTYMRSQRLTVPQLDKSLTIVMNDTTNRGLLTTVATLRPEVFAVSSRYYHRMRMADTSYFEDAAYQELSLRIWRCGGRIIQTACSNVAIYNLYTPLDIQDGTSVSKVDEMWLKEGAWDPFVFRSDVPQNIEKHYPKLQQIQSQLKDNHVTCSANLNLYMKKFIKEVT